MMKVRCLRYQLKELLKAGDLEHCMLMFSEVPDDMQKLCSLIAGDVAAGTMGFSPITWPEISPLSEKDARLKVKRDMLFDVVVFISGFGSQRGWSVESVEISC